MDAASVGPYICSVLSENVLRKPVESMQMLIDGCFTFHTVSIRKQGICIMQGKLAGVVETEITTVKHQGGANRSIDRTTLKVGTHHTTRKEPELTSGFFHLKNQIGLTPVICYEIFEKIWRYMF